MNVRKGINQVLHRCGYQLAKVASYEPSYFGRPEAEIEINDDLIASRIAPHRKHVWLVAPPKSGSTWLTTLLAQLLQWPSVPLLNGYDRREQEVDRRPILRYPSGNIFSPHQHCRASQPTMDFIAQCRVTPLVLTRNIFDSVVSFRDHLINDDVVVPMAFADGQYARMSEERQYDFVIEMVLPWYFNFYASWFHMAEVSPERLLFVSYEGLVDDSVATLKNILSYIQETRSESEIRQAVESSMGMKTRKNKGVAGRGQRLLNERHRAKIANFRQYYPHIDFSSIGI